MARDESRRSRAAGRQVARHLEPVAGSRTFDAACTPDLYIYDARGRLAYRGQFDDSRPKNTAPVTGADARAAVEALLAGQAPSADQKPSIGCNIKWKST